MREIYKKQQKMTREEECVKLFCVNYVGSCVCNNAYMQARIDANGIKWLITM